MSHAVSMAIVNFAFLRPWLRVSRKSRLSLNLNSVFDCQESLERLYLTWVYSNPWDQSIIELKEGIKLFMKFSHTHNFIFCTLAVSLENYITARIISPLVGFELFWNLSPFLQISGFNLIQNPKWIIAVGVKIRLSLLEWALISWAYPSYYYRYNLYLI